MTAPARILGAAREIVEAEGEDALTMRRLADAVGVKAPSLYNHVASRSELLADLQALAMDELAGALEKSRRRPGPPTLGDLASAYHRWATSHPAMYALAMRRPLDRSRLPAGLEERAQAPLLAAAGGDRARARAIWAVAHGLVDLELNGRFPHGADLSAAWAAAVHAFAGPSPPE